MKTALIAGASGLIGKQLIQKLLDSDQYRMIYSLTRKTSGVAHPKFRELVIDFDQLDSLAIDEPIDVVFCTLGTTMNQAGSRVKFRKVDYDYVLGLANLGKRFGATKFQVISSMGADSKSSVFYSKVKGETEEALEKIGFNQLVILRPSLLLGDRSEKRVMESVSGFMMKTFGFLIPDDYKAISAEKVAGYMVKMAAEATARVTLVKSGEMR